MSTEKPRRLGRGLEALLAGRPAISDRVVDREKPPQNAFRSIPVALIQPNPHQPRKEFSNAELADLESSIRANGLLQPITVRARFDWIGVSSHRRRAAISSGAAPRLA